MRIIVNTLLLFVFLGACQEAPQVEVKKQNSEDLKRQSVKKTPNNSTGYSISTLQNANGWGYQIRQNGKLMLDQPTVPGRPGMAGFQTQEDAQKVAELVKSKLQAKIFPPTVSEDELKNLNIH